MMEETFRIVEIKAIYGPVTIVEDKLFSQLKKFMSCSEIAEYSIWFYQFYKESSKASRALMQLVIEVNEPE